MRPLFGLFLVSALSACPTPLPDCFRERVGREGNLRPLLDLTAVPELMVLNEAQTVRVFAPFTACEGETPTFRAELFDADNMPIEVDAQLTLASGLVWVDVSYTPKNAGAHFLRVGFEPNLGARAVSLLVAGPADVTRGAVVKVTDCESPWPLGADAVACETEGEVSVFFSDGGVERFAGEAVATAGDVLWSVEASELQRRALDGGALIRTNRWSGVSTSRLAGQHTGSSAFRLGLGNEVKVLTQHDGVGSTDGVAAQQAEPPPTFYVVTDRGFAEVGLGGCKDFACRLLTFPISFEPGFVWSFDGELASTFLRATPMSLSLDPNPAPPTLLPKRMVEPGSFDGPFELVPLWAGPVLISMRGGSVNASVWPRERVLRVGSNFVVVKGPDASTVRLVPR